MRRNDYELIAGVIKKASRSGTINATIEAKAICILFVEELRKEAGNFDPDKFTIDCGLGGEKK